MIKIGILGDIGSGKSYVARNFGYPVFNADHEVSKLYKKDKKTFYKLKRKLPKYIYSFPINKNQVSKAIIVNKSNLKKIIKVVHQEIKKKLKLFIKKNKEKKFIILDIPLFLENKINSKKDILVFIEANKKKINKRLKKRKNFNKNIYNKLRSLQLPLEFKKKKSHFIIKNNFNNSLKKDVKYVLKKILNNE